MTSSEGREEVVVVVSKDVDASVSAGNYVCTSNVVEQNGILQKTG